MDVIKRLINEDYKLINLIPNGKKPAFGNEWQKQSPEVLKHLCESTLEQKSFALFLGNQPNGRKIFCLDWDVNTGSRGRSQATKDRFDEYLGDCGEDGVFMGSTLENGVVLVDYTDCEGMVKAIEEILPRLGNSGKAKIDEMEIFMGDTSIIALPPHKTECKVSKTLDRERAWLNDVPIVVLEADENPDTSCRVRYFNDIMMKILKDNPKKTLTPQSGEPPEESGDNDKWVQLIMNPEYLGNPRKADGNHLIDRNDFLKIGACLKSNGYSLDVWKRYVALDARNGDGEKTWESLTHTVHRNVLRTLCKKYKPEGLRKWNDDFKLFLTLDTLNKGTNDIANWCAPHLKDSLRCYKKAWFDYNPYKGVWMINEFVSSKIVSFIQQTIDESVAYFALRKANETNEEKKTEHQKTITAFNDHRLSMSHPTTYKSIETLLRSKLSADDEWIEKLDNNPYQIAYKNGILNLRTLKFREGLESSDYLTQTLPFKWVKAKQADKDWVSHEIKKICNYKKEHMERVLGQLGYAFCGDASKIQELYNAKGETASNGKSTIYEVLSKCAPNYVKKLDTNVFEKSMKQMIHKTIATLRGKRVMWLNEMDGSAVQDEAILKNMRDGKPMSYNVMYGVNAMMPIMGKLTLVGNDPINVKGDNGIMRSLIFNQFDSNFNCENGIKEGEDQPDKLMFYSDPKMDEKLFERKDALMELIFEYSKKFAETGKLPPVPNEWKNEKEELRENLCKFDKWFGDTFKWNEKESEWKISKWEVQQMLSEQKGFKITNINTELKRMKLWKTPIQYDSIHWFEGHKGFFTNIAKLTDNDKGISPTVAEF
jgi:phage/plasmid-associated DNA primase